MPPKLASSAAAPFVITLIAAILAYVATGPTLGLYFAGVALSALLMPPLCAKHPRRAALVIAAAITHAIAIVWLAPLFTSSVTFAQWLEAYMVLNAFGGALLLIARASVGLHLPPAVTTILAIAWLSWPIWLAPHVTAPVVALLAPAHPLLALNRVFIDQGIWTQQRLMYAATTLGQDVPYSLPTSIFACAFVHGIIALALLLRPRATSKAL